MMKNLFKLTFLAFVAYSCNSVIEEKSASITYPQSKQEEVTDSYFGTEVKDSYRWLEYDTAADVAEWVKAQNKVTFGYLDQIPFRDNIKKRLEEMYDYTKYGTPYKVGNYFLFSKKEGLQNQSVTYIQNGLEGEPVILLDPNTMSEGGTVSVNIAGFSNDKKFVAWTKSSAGSDWTEIHVTDLATRQETGDVLKWVKFSGASWRGNGFYYCRYDEPVVGKEYSNINSNHKVYFHKMGEPQSDDQLVFEDPKNLSRYYGTNVTDDERFLFLYKSAGTEGNEIYYMDLKAGDKSFKPLVTGFDSKSGIVDNDGDKVLMRTNKNAPKYRLVRFDPRNPAVENWEDLVPESENLLISSGTGGGKIFLTYMKDVTHRVYQADYNGKIEREIELPALGTAGGFGANREDDMFFYSFTSFTYPNAIYKYDIQKGESSLFRQAEVKFNPGEYETKQIFFNSKDGTSVPMFLVHKKGLEKNGKNPTFLYGYGGFNISLSPSFNPFNIALLENGGIYVMVNLRGGGEYGEDWHRAGMLEKKQTVFDDFISAAEYLIKEKYTSSEYLAIEGGSNGGLLVGAVMTQRPELFKVAFPWVGVLDMLRFQKFTVGWGWVPEYGSSDTAAHFPFLYKYSPLHNIREGVSYPATMVFTADHDDRVVPAHSFKFIAELQKKHVGNNPVLIRIQTDAGHGAGKPTSKIIEEQADRWAFMFYNMGLTPYKENKEKM